MLESSLFGDLARLGAGGVYSAAAMAGAGGAGAVACLLDIALKGTGAAAAVLYAAVGVATLLSCIAAHVWLARRAASGASAADAAPADATDDEARGRGGARALPAGGAAAEEPELSLLQVRLRTSICMHVFVRAWRYAFPYSCAHGDMHSRIRARTSVCMHVCRHMRIRIRRVAAAACRDTRRQWRRRLGRPCGCEQRRSHAECVLGGGRRCRGAGRARRGGDGRRRCGQARPYRCGRVC